MRTYHLPPGRLFESVQQQSLKDEHGGISPEKAAHKKRVPASQECESILAVGVKVLEVIVLEEGLEGHLCAQSAAVKWIWCNTLPSSLSCPVLSWSGLVWSGLVWSGLVWSCLVLSNSISLTDRSSDHEPHRRDMTVIRWLW